VEAANSIMIMTSCTQITCAKDEWNRYMAAMSAMLKANYSQPVRAILCDIS
jgi:hypothetical protein